MSLVDDVIVADRIHTAAIGRIKRALRIFFFEWRVNFGFGLPEAVVLCAYATAISLTLPFHESWGDEAQAWLIARNSTVWEIVTHRLHYEGTPALWHLLLHLFYLAHGTFNGVGWLGAACAIAGDGRILALGTLPYRLADFITVHVFSAVPICGHCP